MHSCTALLLLAAIALSAAAPTGHEPVAEHREMVDDMDHGNSHDMDRSHHDNMHDTKGEHHAHGVEGHGHHDDMHDMDGNDGEHKMHDMVAGGTQHSEHVVSVDHDDLEETAAGIRDMPHDVGDHEGDHGEADEGHLKALFDCVEGISQTLCAPDINRRRREDHDHSPAESDNHSEHDAHSKHHEDHHGEHMTSHDETHSEDHDHHGAGKDHQGGSEHEHAHTAGVVAAEEHLPNPMGLFRLQRR